MHTRFARVVVGASVALSLLAFTNVAQASSLTTQQVGAIINLLQAFGADSTTIANVTAALYGQPQGGTGGSTYTPPSCSLFANLKYGDTDATTGGLVSRLQTFVGISPTTGYYGVHTQLGYKNLCVGGNTQPTSVPGMSQYTDSDFGFSFWYPSAWKVTSGAIEYVHPGSGDAYSKVITVSNGTNVLEINASHSPSMSITDASGGGLNRTCPTIACATVEYYFDSSAHQWMMVHPDEETKVPAGFVQSADTSDNTMGGLHIFAGSARFGLDSIVPLSAQNFLVVSSLDAGDTDQTKLVNTIVATDPTVATPVPTAQQIATIQAEAQAYGINSSAQSFSATPTSGTEPLAVTFSGTISTPNPSSAGGLGVDEPYIDFGDGQGNTTSIGEARCSNMPYDLTNYVYPTSCTFSPITHIYRAPGTYTAVLHLGTQKGPEVVLGSVTITVSGSSVTTQTYTNSQYGFTLQYPSGSNLGSLSQWSWLTSANTGNPIIEISFPNSTNDYAQGRVDIGLSYDTTDVANCLIVPPTNETVYKNLGNVTINGTTFLHFSAGSVGGGVMSADAYRVLHDNACVALDSVLTGVESGHYPSSSQAAIQADFTQIQNQLGSSVQSFRFTN